MVAIYWLLFLVACYLLPWWVMVIWFGVTMALAESL
jgi:hypothetical protein